jgi:dihydrodipicolinate synthase/N-acetylneuraminate lyase
MNWQGVLPATTTAFGENLAVDHHFMAQHAVWMLDNGCSGLVMLGSLGEGATLDDAEKVAILQNTVKAVAGRGPVVAAISSLSTSHAVALAKKAEAAGCAGLMVLPPYVYSTDWREMREHVSAVIGATPLPCMLYNNPVAYRTDFLPEQIADLAQEHANLQAVKESSADLRRVTAIRAVLGNRLTIAVGVDDAIVEGAGAGARGWVAGLVNAFPAESVALFDLAVTGRTEQASLLYQWFLPLLRMDTVPKFVQLIKWVQGEMGVGSPRVRGPRLELIGTELAEAQEILFVTLQNRPKIREVKFPGLVEA